MPWICTICGEVTKAGERCNCAKLTRDDVQSVAHGRVMQKQRTTLMILLAIGFSSGIAILALVKDISFYAAIPIDIAILAMLVIGFYLIIYRPKHKLEAKLLEEWKEHIVS